MQRGAWADMLLVNGDPTQDINVLKAYERNLAAIIKPESLLFSEVKKKSRFSDVRT